MTDRYLLLIFLSVFCILILPYFASRIQKVGKEAAIKEAKAIAYELMVRAEKRLSTEDGQAKMRFVMDRFWDLVPPPIKILIPKHAAEKFLQAAYDELKEQMDNDEDNSAEIEEK